MTLDVYEKLLEEKRKALLALKTEERKVDVDKEFKSMQPLSSKKSNDDIFVKLVRAINIPNYSYYYLSFDFTFFWCINLLTTDF